MGGDWKRALELFEHALDLSVEARARLISDVDKGDAELAAQLQSLIEADRRSADHRLDERVQAAIVDPVAATGNASGFDVGQWIGPYRLLRAIGSGGMASVWLAEREDGALRRNFALKLPYPASIRRGFAERFARERDILARLRHAHIARLHDAGVDSAGQPYLALDHIEGEQITQWCDARNLPLPARLQLFEQVLEAVQFAHANLVIHRDLKPGNILVDSQGEVSLLDFGIARLLDATDGHVADTALTEAGSRMLTVQYASPEQIRGESLTIASDIYSLGVVLHELIAGARPYRLAFLSAAQLEQAISEAAREPLTRQVTAQRAHQLGLRSARAMRRAVGGDLDAIVARAMAEPAAHRYASAAALRDDLRRLLDGHAVEARRPSRLRSVLRFARRHALASTIVTVLLLALLASTVLSIVTAQRERAQRERAESVREFLVGVFAQANPDENKGQPFTAQELLEKGERLLAEQRDAPVATRADLTAVIGNLYWSIGAFERAEPLLLQALMTRRDPHIADDIKARALIGLANMQAEKRAFDEALANLDEALRFALDAGEDGATLAADARRQQADVLVRRGDFAEAENVLRELLVSDARQFGARSEEMAHDWRLLAVSLEELSRYDESAAAFEQAISIYRNVHGDVHSTVSYALNDLGLMLMHRGDLAGAERALREALKNSRILFGAETRATWAVQSNLLRVLEHEGRFAEALPERLHMLAKEKATLSQTTPETLAFHTNFTGIDYRELGRFEEAEAMFRDAISQWSTIHGDDNTPDSAAATMNLGITLGLRGRHADAVTAMQKGIAIRRANEPEGSMTLNLSRGELGHVLRIQGRFAEALKEHREAVSAYEKVLHDGGESAHPTLALLLAMRAESELDNGSAAAAEASANDALIMARAVLPSANVRLGSILFALARAKLALENATAAEPLLRETLAVRSPPYPADDPRVLEVKVALVGALDLLARDDEADDLRRSIEPALRAMANPYAQVLLARLEQN